MPVDLCFCAHDYASHEEKGCVRQTTIVSEGGETSYQKCGCHTFVRTDVAIARSLGALNANIFTLIKLIAPDAGQESRILKV